MQWGRCTVTGRVWTIVRNLDPLRMGHRHKHKTTEHKVLGGGESWDLELDKEFTDLTQNTQSTQGKIDDLDFMETERVG